MIRKLFLFCLLALLLLWPSHSAAYTVQYDKAFRQWGQFYFPFEDWKWFKAQGLAESGLNQSAVSWCGATGIMQLMPATAKELGVNPYDTEANIQGGIKYDSRLKRYWLKIPSTDERRNFIFASYNAGPGWIIKANKLTSSQKWEDTALKLQMITGKHAAETIGYIKHIKTFYWQIQ